MRPRNVLLTAIGAVVVVGGIYLWLDVRGSDAAQPSAAKVAEAQARHARAGGASVEGDISRGDRLRVRPPRVDSAGADPARTGASFPTPRNDLPGMDPAVFQKPPPLEQPDRLQGGSGPAIDPDKPELASAMTESNKMYDRGDYEGARTMAMKLLDKEPGNVRMLRVVVSSSCIMGDAEVATKFWMQLPSADQAQMSIRCARYQVSFPTPNEP